MNNHSEQKSSLKTRLMLARDHAASLWGIECNYPDSDNSYLTTVANELLPEALELAKAKIAKLTKLTEKPRVIVRVEGGIVQAVYSDQPLDVTVCDLDDQSEDPVLLSEPELYTLADFHTFAHNTGIEIPK